MAERSGPAAPEDLPPVESLPLVPGLRDDAFVSDGVMTKRYVRAMTLAALGPRAGEHLWDVGGGSGTVSVEWARAHPSCTAEVVETKPGRVALVEANIARFDLAGRVSVVAGAAPAALESLSGTPDAVFIGGGITVPGVIGRCVAALRPGGRLVTNAVTLESEAAVTAAAGRHGGELVRLAVSGTEQAGGFRLWAPARPIVMWVWSKPDRSGRL